MLRRLIVQTTVWLAVMGAILFVAAGDVAWPQGWIFLAEIALCSFAVGFWLLRYDPVLLASRLSSPVQQRDQMPWDRMFMRAVLVVFIGWMVLIGLDARRFEWSHVPVWLQVVGAGLIALSMFLICQIFRFQYFRSTSAKDSGRAGASRGDGGAVSYCPASDVCGECSVFAWHAVAAGILVGCCGGAGYRCGVGAENPQRGGDAAARTVRL